VRGANQNGDLLEWEPVDPCEKRTNNRKNQNLGAATENRTANREA
jgi:hypothetical protein